MNLEHVNGRRLFVALCAALVLACAEPAQAQAESRKPRAEKLSEYVNQFTTCNAGAHLDNLVIHLQNDPTAKGYVRIYGPGGPDNAYAERAVRATRNYLISSRGVEESRLRVAYGGRYASMEELLTEVWLLPEGAEPPPVRKYKPDLGFVGKVFEADLWDGLDEGEGWSDWEEVALVGLSDMLRKRADARIYLVAHHGVESTPGAWRRVTGQQAEKLSKYGVAAERVKIIFGGYAKKAKLQVWILPSDAPPPAKQRHERRPEQSVRIAEFSDAGLQYGDSERWGFNGFADVLKADPQLTGCLVVRLAPAEPKDADPEIPVDPDAPPDVDVLQLAEKWKAELKKSGIGEHRLIIMVVQPREDQSGGELETWVVPPGAPLPDPSAEDEESVAEEEAENPKEF